MWTSWLPSRVRTTPRSRSFSCSSFKDVLSLSTDQQHDTDSSPASPRSPTIFHRIELPRSSSTRNNSSELSPQPTQSIVIYFTSLRVVRKTFEDCRVVLSILHGLGVPIDERDLSMDARFVCELQRIMGGRLKVPPLPCVFIGGRLISGAEELKRLYESGELVRMIGGVSQSVGGPRPCRECGGLKFVMCRHCNGSRKISIGKARFRSCTDCNMHGLMKCRSCSSALSEKPYRSSSIDIPMIY